ncbi:MAG TPA: YihY/virulence factor BrkB family protein [Polyangia bacterium]
MSGDDAWHTLAATGWLRLLRDAAVRLRAADGFSHARSLAFAMSLVFVQGLIALVGLAVACGQSEFSRTIFSAVAKTVPGPAGHVLARAVAQAQKVGLEHRFLPLLVGLGGTLVTASTATGQLMRGINRLYGIEKDPPFLRKYGRAAVLALVILAAFVGAGAALTAGRELSSAASDSAEHAWRIGRWPVALGLAAASFGAIMRWAPRRRQPQWSWLAFGGAIGVLGWTLVTVAFSVAFRTSSAFGVVYGPLAGIVALQLWTFCSAVAIFFGVAIAAELEAVRSGTDARTGDLTSGRGRRARDRHAR